MISIMRINGQTRDFRLIWITDFLTNHSQLKTSFGRFSHFMPVEIQAANHNI